jgi:hypothetical protein
LRFTILQAGITIELTMLFAKSIPALLLIALSLGPFGPSADAVTTYRGSRTYFTLLGSNIKFPIFTKEFTEGDGIIAVGGVKQVWLDDTHQTLGFRLSRGASAPMAPDLV